jgi:hypothetical protein
MMGKESIELRKGVNSLRRKQFRMLMASNPVLYDWMSKHAGWVKQKPEVMMYLAHHPNAIEHFKPGQPIDNERIARNAQAFMGQKLQERMAKKGKKPVMKDNRQNRPVLSLPPLVPPGHRMANKKPAANQAIMSPIHSIRKSLGTFPRISRRKFIDSMSQTVEMLDVITALMGKLGELK